MIDLPELVIMEWFFLYVRGARFPEDQLVEMNDISQKAVPGNSLEAILVGIVVAKQHKEVSVGILIDVL